MLGGSLPAHTPLGAPPQPPAPAGPPAAASSPIPNISRVSLKPCDRAWEKDDSRKTCSLCATPFTTFSNRRHHCRVCGSLVCGRCAHPTVLLDGLHLACRDCIDCHTHVASVQQQRAHSAPVARRVLRRRSRGDGGDKQQEGGEWEEGRRPASVLAPGVSAAIGHASLKLWQPPVHPTPEQPMAWLMPPHQPARQGDLEFFVVEDDDGMGAGVRTERCASLEDHHAPSLSTTLTWRLCWVVLERGGRILVFHKPQSPQPIALTNGQYVVDTRCDAKVVGARAECFCVTVLSSGDRWFFSDVRDDAAGWVRCLQASPMCPKPSA